MAISSEQLKKVVEGVKVSVARKLSSVCGEDTPFNKLTKEFSNDLIGIVSFVGDVNFILLLMLKDEQIRKISLNFVGVEMDSSSDEFGDLISEVANIVFGDITMDLKALDIIIERSLPTILKGKNLQPILRKKAPSLIMSFGKDDILVELIGTTDATFHKTPGT